MDKSPINLHNADALKPKGTPLAKHHKAYSTGELSVFIISASIPGMDASAELFASKELHELLCIHFGVGFVKQIQTSKGAGFVVNGELNDLRGIASAFNQESILWLDSSRNAVLVYTTPHGTFHGKEIREKALGRLVTCTEEEAQASDYWAYDATQFQYFHIV